MHSGDVVTVLLIFAIIHHSTYTFSHANTEAHTHKHTCVISTQEEWRQLGTGAWLRGMQENFCLRQMPCIHTKKENRKKMIFTNLKKKIRAHRASSKANRLLFTKWSKQHQSIMNSNLRLQVQLDWSKETQQQADWHFFWIIIMMRMKGKTSISWRLILACIPAYTQISTHHLYIHWCIFCGWAHPETGGAVQGRIVNG